MEVGPNQLGLEYLPSDQELGGRLTIVGADREKWYRSKGVGIAGACRRGSLSAASGGRSTGTLVGTVWS
jgi:hypothetical protein